MDEGDVATESVMKDDKILHSFRYNIPKGIPGECEDCGEERPRLIGGVCAFCRDGRI